MSEDDPDNQLVRVDHGALALTILADNRILSEMVGASLLLAKESTLAPPKSNSLRRHFLLHQIPPERVKEILEKFPAKPPTPAAPAADGQSIGNPDIDAIIQEASEREYLREAKGLYRSKGDGMTVENIRAFGLFLRVAEAGHSEAQCYLGECYRYGDGVGQDHVEAVKWYREAAGQGNALAQISLYYCYPYGDGVPDFAERFKSIRKAAKQGDAVAQTQLGVCYHCGLGVRQDHAEAVKWYRKAAEQGDIDGQTQLGRCYRYGQGVPKDYEESAKWYRKAAEQAYNAQPQPSRTTDTFKRVEPIPPSRPTDIDSLAREFESLVREGKRLYRSKGDGMTDENIRAFGLFLRAAEAGNSEAQNYLGKCYAYGEGVPRDRAEAVKWLKISANAGYALAFVSLGWLCECGSDSNIPIHQDEAVRWYQQAVEAGCRGACHLIASIYHARSDIAQELKWNKEAALMGDLDGLCAVRKLHYDNGYERVGDDKTEAYAWFRLYEDHFLGCRPTNTATLAALMSSPEIVRAERLHQELKAQMEAGERLNCEFQEKNFGKRKTPN